MSFGSKKTRRPHTIRDVFVIVLPIMLWLAYGMTSYAQTSAPPAAAEYSLKAVFLYNFAKFVEWPQDIFVKPDQPLVIGIYNFKPFKKNIEPLRGKTFMGHPIEFVPMDQSDGRVVHILYLNTKDAEAIRQALEETKTSPVLTVGDTSEFLDQGGIMRFFLENKRLRFEINPEAARRKGLQPSSKLLDIAVIYQDKERSSAP